MYRAVAQLVPALRAWFRAVSRPDERGQTLVEYGLLLFFIAIVVIAVLIVLGPTVSGIFRSVNDQI
jgi:pilus assembly protein Flp/PilA